MLARYGPFLYLDLLRAAFRLRNVVEFLESTGSPRLGGYGSLGFTCLTRL